jgi:hypothetical protein
MRLRERLGFTGGVHRVARRAGTFPPGEAWRRRGFLMHWHHRPSQAAANGSRSGLARILDSSCHPKGGWYAIPRCNFQLKSALGAFHAGGQGTPRPSRFEVDLNLLSGGLFSSAGSHGPFKLWFAVQQSGHAGQKLSPLLEDRALDLGREDPPARRAGDQSVQTVALLPPFHSPGDTSHFRGGRQTCYQFFGAP